MKETKPVVYIAGSGSYLPGNPVSFENVDKILGDLNEIPASVKKWLSRMKNLLPQMLGIEQYFYALDPSSREFIDDNVSMSVKAAKKALDNAGIKAKDIDLIVYGSAHQDQMPTTSVRIQEELGIETCAEMSIHANCTSAYKAMLVAYEFIKSGRYKRALVMSSNISSSELRAEYYNQPIVKKEELFLRYFLCDGAGAIVLEGMDTKKKKGLYLDDVYIESIGGKKPSAMRNKRPAYWMNPKEEYEKGYHHLAQLFNENLQELFFEKDGSIFFKGLKRMLNSLNGDIIDNVKFFQVNFPSQHIAELVIEECEKLGLKKETLYSKMATIGYPGPPMVFMCLDKIIHEENMQNNDFVVSFVTEVSKFMQAGYVASFYEDSYSSQNIME